MEHNHLNKDGFWGGFTSFIISVIYSIYTNINWWAVLQSLICAILGFFVVRTLSKYFPKKDEH